MRCPKCGYTSFDHLEICKKCNRAITDLVSGIDGTVYNALAPTFLKLTEKMPPQTPTVSEQPWEDEADVVDDDETEGAVRKGIDTEFFLDDDIATGTGEVDDEVVMNLDDFEEVSPREEFTLDLEDDEDEKELNVPALDFGDLDISDLAPPFEEDLQQPAKKDEPVAAMSARQTVPSPHQGPAPAVLEDLQYNGLDLDAPSRFVSGSAAGKRYSPSVKTGTALDKFDIDLGDLFKKDEK